MLAAENNDVTHPQKPCDRPRRFSPEKPMSFESLTKRIPEGETVLVEGYRIQSPSLSSVMSAEAGEPGFVDFGGPSHSTAVREALDRLDIKYISWSSEPSGLHLGEASSIFGVHLHSRSSSTAGRFVAYCSTEKTTSSHHTSALERLLGVFPNYKRSL